MIKSEQNPMRKIMIAKLTLNVGAGKDEDKLKKGLLLLQKLAPIKPVKTVTQKRIPTWSLRPGLAIGAKVTVRKNPEELLKRLLKDKHYQKTLLVLLGFLGSFKAKENLKKLIKKITGILRLERD